MVIAGFGSEEDSIWITVLPNTHGEGNSSAFLPSAPARTGSQHGFTCDVIIETSLGVSCPIQQNHVPFVIAQNEAVSRIERHKAKLESAQALEMGLLAITMWPDG